MAETGREAPDIAALAEIARASADREALLLALAGRLGARTMLELGVWRGDLAERMLREAPGIETYWMLDPWRPLEDWNKPFNVDAARFEAVHAEAMARTEFAAGRRRVLRGTTTERADELPDGGIDLAYVDGDHTLRGVAIDLVALWPKIRPGGVLAGDDFVPSAWQHGVRFEPTFVFPFAVHFAEAAGAPILAAGHGQFAILKPADGARAFSFTDVTGRYGARGVLHQMRLMPSPARRALNRVRRMVRRRA